MVPKECHRLISEALQCSPFRPAGLIDALKSIRDLQRLFESPAGWWDRKPNDYTLEQHTIHVGASFERYFSKRTLPGNITLPFFRLAVALHDIGKPLTEGEMSTASQHSHTLSVLDQFEDCFPITPGQFVSLKAMLGGDPIGSLLQQHIALKEASHMIEAASADAGLSPANFLDALTILYQCDVAAYTKSSGYRSNWLLPVFESREIPGTDEREPLFDEALGRLRFSAEGEAIYGELRDALPS